MGANIKCPCCGQTRQYEDSDAEIFNLINGRGVKVAAFLVFDCQVCNKIISIGEKKWKEMNSSGNGSL